ncbi:MAG TPA: DUF302 domain-containing protein [Pyrinomonadaceae bacterium]
MPGRYFDNGDSFSSCQTALKSVFRQSLVLEPNLQIVRDNRPTKNAFGQTEEKAMEHQITPKNGVIEVASKRAVAETIDRLEQIVKSKGMTVFARINHAAAAKSVGLEMRPTELLIFGDPRVGTALMKSCPQLAIDLPLKALSWEDENGRVWLAYNSPVYLQKRYGLEETPFQAIGNLIDEVVK